LIRPDSVTQSAATARDEIGRALAAKISELRTGRDLSRVVEDVLPEIEKFLESPEERRLRRMRTGVTLAAIGSGVTLFLLLIQGFAHDQMPWPAGLVVLFLGLGILINGAMLSVPRRNVEDRASFNPSLNAAANALNVSPSAASNPKSITAEIEEEPA